MQRVGGLLVVAADQRAEDRHMLLDGDDIALLEIAGVPLIVEVENHRDNLQRLVEKRVIGGGEDQAMEVAVQRGKLPVVLADGVAQLSVAA